MRNKSNTLRLNKKGFESSLLNNVPKAVDGFRSITAQGAPNKHKMRSEGFSTTWPNLFSNTFATDGEF